MRRAFPVALLTCFLTIAGTHAQDSVEPGARLRVLQCTPQCASTTGTLLGLGQGLSSVVIHFGEELGPVEVPFERIERLEVSRGRDTDKMAGATLGAIAAGGITFWALKGAGSPCTADAGLFCEQSTGARIGITAAAAAVGAVVGILLAPGSENWEVISPNDLTPDLGANSRGLSSLGVAVRF